MAMAIFVRLPTWRFSFDSFSCKTKPVLESTMIKAPAAATRWTAPRDKMKARKRAGKRINAITIFWKRLHGSRADLIGNRKAERPPVGAA